MAKTKTTEKILNGSEHIEAAVKNGAEAFKTNFDKAVKGYDKFLGLGKENLEAVVASATVAGKGVETIHNETYAFSKQSIEDAVAATKAVLASKSAHEAFELQTDFEGRVRPVCQPGHEDERDLHRHGERRVRSAPIPLPGMG